MGILAATAYTIGSGGTLVAVGAGQILAACLAGGAVGAAIPDPSFGSSCGCSGLRPNQPLPQYYGADETEQENETGQERDWRQDKELTKEEIEALKRGGEDIHGLKGKKNAAKRDLYKDKNGNIFVKPKGGQCEGEDTGLNINDYF
ncbi:polymorphic toxin type 33 domain-containing protein [Anthocerotibacter panamensis]|uniref:polymorphic toxin type 33 domain-containing protein n=1 Tax=Anthocerotibacter panamensis TaxID=2857077 RepID=UPI0028F40195|nr:polymorphic toxin type 33 domain-containing protein [Anthocerotibacter panamensis]